MKKTNIIFKYKSHKSFLLTICFTGENGKAASDDANLENNKIDIESENEMANDNNTNANEDDSKLGSINGYVCVYLRKQKRKIMINNIDK